MPPVEKPNYTQIPNVILDNIARMTMPEFAVVMAICRQTFGWHKKSEKVSVSQLQAITGLSKHAVLDALDAALADGWITRKPAGQTYRYTVNVQERTGAANAPLPDIPVQQMHRYPKRTGAADAPVTGAANAPVPVPEMHRLEAQNPEVAAPPKERKEIYKESSSSGSGGITRAQTPPTPAISIYREVFGTTPNRKACEAITETVTDTAHWRDVLTQWALKGYSTTNVVDMLDVYAHGWKQRSRNGAAPAPDSTPNTFESTLIFQEPAHARRS